MEQYDVIVIGGGPGGSTVSTLVALDGHKVLLLEKEQFPRHQIGESLLPSTIQSILPLLGAEEAVKTAGFVPKMGGTFSWGKSKEPWTFYFDIAAINSNQPPQPKALQVERAKFDEILLQNAKNKGVEVKQGYRVINIVQKNDRVIGIQYQGPNNKIVEAKAKYVVDASGYLSTFYHHVGRRVSSTYFDNVAVYSYFYNGKRLPSPCEGNIISAAFQHGWIWYIPLTVSPELTSVGVVVNKEFFLNCKMTQEKLLTTCIELCPIIKEYLATANRVNDDNMYDRIRVRRDYSYSCTKLWKPGMVLIGDAGCFIDPVFSSGVHLTTFSGLLAARSINTTLRGLIDEQTCFENFERKYRRDFANFYNFLVAFYDMDQEQESYFWSAKKIVKSQSRPEHAFIKLISGYSAAELPDNLGFDEFSLIKEAVINMAFGAMTGRESNSQSKDKINYELPEQSFMYGFSKEIIDVHAKAMGLYGHPLSDELVPADDSLYWKKPSQSDFTFVDSLSKMGSTETE